MLTNQTACSTFDRRGQSCQPVHREQDPVLLFQVHSLLWTKVYVWHSLENPQIDSILCEQQRSNCSDFNYNFVQCKRNTTLISISLKCNPLSSKFCLQGPIFLIAPFQLFFSLRFVSLFTSCQYWESSSVSQESHLCTGRDQHDAPPLWEAWSQRQRQTYWCIQTWWKGKQYN